MFRIVANAPIAKTAKRLHIRCARGIIKNVRPNNTAHLFTDFPERSNDRVVNAICFFTACPMHIVCQDKVAFQRWSIAVDAAYEVVKDVRERLESTIQPAASTQGPLSLARLLLTSTKWALKKTGSIKPLNDRRFYESKPGKKGYSGMAGCAICLFPYYILLPDRSTKRATFGVRHSQSCLKGRIRFEAVFYRRPFDVLQMDFCPSKPIPGRSLPFAPAQVDKSFFRRSMGERPEEIRFTGFSISFNAQGAGENDALRISRYIVNDFLAFLDAEPNGSFVFKRHAREVGAVEEDGDCVLQNNGLFN